MGAIHMSRYRSTDGQIYIVYIYIYLHALMEMTIIAVLILTTVVLCTEYYMYIVTYNLNEYKSISASGVASISRSFKKQYSVSMDQSTCFPWARLHPLRLIDELF